MIGFFVPKNVKWSPNNFRWSDGSQINFVGWDISGIPRQPDNQIPNESFVKLRKKFKSKGWHDYQLKEMKTILCKMNAIQNTPVSTTLTTSSSSKVSETQPSTTSSSAVSPTTTTPKTTTKEIEATTTLIDDSHGTVIITSTSIPATSNIPSTSQSTNTISTTTLSSKVGIPALIYTI